MIMIKMKIMITSQAEDSTGRILIAQVMHGGLIIMIIMMIVIIMMIIVILKSCRPRIALGES